MLTHVAARVPEVLQRFFGEEVRIAHLREVTSGAENHVFALDVDGAGGADGPLVLKLYSGGAATARRESELMIALRAHGYPVPEVFAVELDEQPLGRAFVVMRRIEGRTLAAVMRAEPAESARWLRCFAELAARLHGLDAALFAHGVAHDAREYLQRELARHEQSLRDLEVPEFCPVLDWLIARAAELHVRGPSLIHQDYHPFNVVVDERGEPYVLDWTIAHVTDPRNDLAQTFQMLASSGFGSLRGPIVSAYEAASGRALDGMEYFDVFAALKNVAGQYAVLDDGERKRPALWARLSRRPDFAQRAGRQRASVPALQRTYAVIAELSGVRVPEAEALFARLLA